MNNFEIKDDHFNQSMTSYVDIVGRTNSILVGVAESDYHEDGNIFEAVIDEDKMYKSLIQSVQEWFDEKSVGDTTIEFPAQRWTDDSDEPVEYTATMELADFDIDVRFSDEEYYGGLKMELTVCAPDDNEDFDNEISLEPVVLLAAWKLEELLNADKEFWNTITCQAFDDSVSYEIVEEETA